MESRGSLSSKKSSKRKSTSTAKPEWKCQLIGEGAVSKSVLTSKAAGGVDRGGGATAKKGGKKRSRNSMEKLPGSDVDEEEDTEFTSEEFAAGGGTNSPQKKKRRTRKEDSVDYSVSFGEGRQVVRSRKGDVNVNVISPSTSPPPHKLSYLPSTWSPEMVTFYDTPKDESITMSQVLSRMSGDRRLWVLPPRLLPPPPKGKSKWIRCDNCNQRGHVKRQCPDPPKGLICTVCGNKGHNYTDTTRPKCNMTMCLNCGKSQDRFFAGCAVCTFTTNPPVCSLCGLKCHKDSSCPDNWRRFHSTTTVAYVTNEDLVEEVIYNYGGVLTEAEYRPQLQSFCANCGKKGHSFHTCPKPLDQRLSQYKRQKPFIYKQLSNPVRTSTSTATQIGVGADGEGKRKRREK